MMHPNFYHWHNRVELKPEPTALKGRWDAAANFAEEFNGDVACSLLRLALFGSVEPKFAKRFSDAVIAQEPTFPPEENAELLRVMATAALYSKMETGSDEADAVALGFVAAAFHPDRISPVCKELGMRATDYLASESERMRPTPKLESDYRALQKAAEAEAWADDAEAVKLVGDAILELGETMGRIAEENQFLWWLLGKRSPLLQARREKLSSKEYALVAGAEAAERVALLPPPASVESLIGEVLSHCSKASNASVPLAEIIDSANIECLTDAAAGDELGELCPLHGILGLRRAGGKVDDASIQKFKISVKLKVSPTDAANQYFHELMFLRAVTILG